ncbi:pectin acetylesterase 8-like isoform X2 [Nicotiana sylvestris]|uniref:pectin acetylesterase 8-like isoform X2 n=1 Tax=Nicotiana sylvestris TaxID=4096 RepID=UPI00388C7555
MEKVMATVFFSLLCLWTTTEAKDLYVNITYLETAITKGAVCLDGSAPAFHFHPGTGSGINSWLIHLQGGGWCETTSDCLARATTDLSSKNMSKIAYFTGVLSSDPQFNPDFYNWNRVKIRYCDGSSYIGDIEEVDPAILSGTSAGGLGAILHCDKFRLFLPLIARVKCISDAGFFVNVEAISGEPLIEEKYKRVVALHGSAKNLPLSCTALSSDPNLCFFPQYVARHICTPLFIVNSAYDSWQINNSLVPQVADPNNEWPYCKHDINICSPSQIQTLQDFRLKFLEALNELGPSISRGYFISSCHFHNGIEIQNYWSSRNSPTLANKTIAEAIGDWFFDRSEFQGVYCPYPCGKFCQ